MTDAIWCQWYPTGSGYFTQPPTFVYVCAHHPHTARVSTRLSAASEQHVGERRRVYVPHSDKGERLNQQWMNRRRPT